MTKKLHILRTAYQINSLHELYEIQLNFRTVVYGKNKAVQATTRRKPKRAEEIKQGGSVYWIIKNQIQARQEVLDIDFVESDYEKDYCRIFLNPEIIRTKPQPKRSIQGWRYLKEENAPEDLGAFDPNADELPNEMLEELKDLGVL